MPKSMEIKNLEGIDWRNNHYIPEEKISLQDFIDDKSIEIGDIVTVENKAEYEFPLNDNEFCVIFRKNHIEGGTFFHEEPFSLEECKILFGDDFSY